MKRGQFLKSLIGFVIAPAVAKVLPVGEVVRVANVQHDLVEVKAVAEYAAAYTRFSKQMIKNLPFLQDTLPKILLRDFEK